MLNVSRVSITGLRNVVDNLLNLENLQDIYGDVSCSDNEGQAYKLNNNALHR